MPSVYQAPAKRVKVISGLRAAKATVTYPRWRRLHDAVDWVHGEAAIAPTAKQAAEIFRVPYPVLRQALARTKHHTNGNGNSSTALSDAVIENIITEVGIDRVWRVIDKLTQPELPLQAVAE